MATGGSINRQDSFFVLFALATLLGSEITYPAFAQQNAQVVELNNEAVRALNAANYRLAIQKFEEALKADPSYELARKNLAIAYNNLGLQMKGQPQQAIKMFHKALYLDPLNDTTKSNIRAIIGMMERDPNKFSDRIDLGDFARKEGDFVGAIVEYQAACAIKDDAAVREKLGDVFRVQDKLDRAIQEYTNATRIKDMPGTEVKLGQAYQAKGDVPNAIKALGQALKLNPNDSDVLDALVAAWEDAVSKNPTSPENHIGLGQALQFRGDFDQAKEEFSQAIRFSPGRNNPVAAQLLQKLPEVARRVKTDQHVNAGLKFQAGGKLDQALEEYKAALETDPKNADIWVNIGTVYQARKDYNRAMQAYQQAQKFDPSNARAAEGIKTAGAQLRDQQIDALEKQGQELFKAQRYDDAIKVYEQLLKMEPDDAATHFNLGAALQAKKDIDSAILEYKRAISLDKEKKSGQYQQALEDALDIKAQPTIDKAVAAHKAKNYPEAIDLYEQSLKMRPKNDELWYNLAAACYSRQDFRKSAMAYQKAYELNPKNRADSLYFIGTIDEDGNNGGQALSDYREYLKKAPTGTYAEQAKARVKALTKDLTATIKIKSESEIAQDKEALDAFQKGTAAYKAKQYDEAEKWYQRAVDLRSNNPDYVYGLGTAKQGLGKYDEAMALYQKAKSLAKGDTKFIDDAMTAAMQDKAQPIVDQAVKKQTAGDNEGAIPLFQQALQLIPNNCEVWKALGIAYQQTDQFDRARDAYDRAYKADAQKCLDCLYLMAVIDEHFSQGSKAKGEFDLYLKKAPNGQYAAPAKQRSDALAKNPNDTQKLQTRGEIAKAEQVGKAYESGVQKQKNGDYDGAIADYKTAMDASPNEPAYPFALGTSYQAKGDLENAETYYKKAISLSKGKNQLKQFQQVLDGLIELKAAPLLEKANKFYQDKKFAEAAQAYDEVLKITPNNADALLFKGASLQNIGSYPKARAAYEQSYKIGGKAKADCLYYLAVLDENDNNPSAAIQHYTLYIQMAPQGAFRPQTEQRIRELRANPKSCQKLTTVAQQEASAAVQAAYNQAISLQQAGKLDEALAEYNKAIEGMPNEASVYYARGTCYQARSQNKPGPDLDLAQKDYEKAFSINSKEKAYKDALTGVLQIKTAPLLESAIKKQTTPDAAGKYDFAGAITDYQAALKINPYDAGTHMNLGTAFQASGDLQNALREYTSAIQLDPNMAEAYYYRGTVYEELKQTEAAKKDYQKYIQLAPTGPNVNDAKNRLKALGGGAAPPPKGKHR